MVNGAGAARKLHIAGWNTANDWKRLRAKLLEGGNDELWRSAYEDYFRRRLELRYLGPIKALQDSGSYRGEGFSIVAIQCTLFEFLQSTINGTNYRFLNKGEKLGPNEYASRGIEASRTHHVGYSDVESPLWPVPSPY